MTTLVAALAMFLLLLSFSRFAESAPASGGFSAYLDRSYYTTEDSAIIVCQLEPPLGATASTEVIVRAQDGNLLARGSVAEGGLQLPVQIHSWSAGTHNLTVSVSTPGNGEGDSQDLTLVKHPPKPGCEWKIDRINRIVLRDGEPFFPYGIMSPGTAADFESAAEIGYNTLHTWRARGNPGRASEYVQNAEKHGILTIVRLGEFCASMDPDLAGLDLSEKAEDRSKHAFRQVSPKKVNAALVFDGELKKVAPEIRARLYGQYYTGNEARIADAIARTKDHPSLLGYFLFDEPIDLSEAYGRPLYRQVYDADGYHPCYVVYSSHVPDGDEYVDWMDVLGTDPYWVPADGGRRGTVNYVSRITVLTDRRAASRRQVTWSVPMAEYYSGIRKRAILPKEQSCQTYLAIIHGAKAITYFRWPFKTQESYEAHRALARQMAVLGPIAVTPDLPQTVRYSPGEFDLENDQLPDVQVSLRRNPAGGYVLLAANTRYCPVDATYWIAGLGEVSTAGRLFSDREHPVQNGSFGDRLGFMDTRAYTLVTGVEIDDPVEITVTTVAHPEETDPVYGAPGHPDTGRPGKRNLLRNPGFEEAAFPNWPDYYLFSDGCSLDSEQAFEGTTCLKINSGSRQERVYAACSPDLEESTGFVLSAYMRADRDGVTVRFLGFGWRVPEPTFGYKDITLTTEWKRYWEAGTLIPGLPKWHSVGVLVPADQSATVYVDAMQFEKGQSPTDYDP
ncbi:MAG: hypothetical protein QGI83_09030 [Candidatus Latescibacteria bacterium]|jgi:hypothetical protein|nr:hypothetical protein [Candidatus Latescibacterota bacterium]